MKRLMVIGLLVIVVIAAILILPPIFSCVGCTGFANDPVYETVGSLNSLFNQPDQIETPEVVFTPSYILSAVALADRIPLSKEQICMSLGDYKDSGDFELTTDGAHKITHGGTSNKVVRIVVTCNLNKELLEESIQGTMFENWEHDCSICEGQGRCCLIALKRP